MEQMRVIYKSLRERERESNVKRVHESKTLTMTKKKYSTTKLYLLLEDRCFLSEINKDEWGSAEHFGGSLSYYYF